MEFLTLNLIIILVLYSVLVMIYILEGNEEKWLIINFIQFQLLEYQLSWKTFSYFKKSYQDFQEKLERW